MADASKTVLLPAQQDPRGDPQHSGHLLRQWVSSLWRGLRELQWAVVKTRPPAQCQLTMRLLLLVSGARGVCSRGAGPGGGEQCPGTGQTSQGVPGWTVGEGLHGAPREPPFPPPLPKAWLLVCPDGSCSHVYSYEHMSGIKAQAHIQARTYYHPLPSAGVPLCSLEEAGGGLGPHRRGGWAVRGRHPWCLGLCWPRAWGEARLLKA